MTVDPDTIRFELERLSASKPGRVELTGRWFGIRGRRFVRPTLMLTLLEDGTERRCLADLEHKPWAAEDGELWTAAFPVDAGLEAAESITLCVAPDITVEVPHRPLASRRRARERPDTPTKAAPDAADRRAARPSDGSEAGKERPRRSIAEQVIEQERARRKSAERALRSLQRELDAATADRPAPSSESESARNEAREAQRGHEQAIAERDQAIRAKARAESRAHERDLALAKATQALAEERAEAERLRAQLARAQAVLERASESAHQAQNPIPDRTERPLNPSLRHKWLARLLVVLVMLGVIAAILLVVRTTVSL